MSTSDPILEDWPTVSVIVPVLDEAGSVEACLQAIREQDYPPEHVEIVAIDGGSTDGSGEIIDRLVAADPRCRRLDRPGRPVSAILNAGIEATTGEIIVRVDAHAFVEVDYLRRCVEALRETGADNAGGPMRPAGTTAVGKAVAVAMRHRFGVGTARFRFARQRQEVDTVYLGAFRRQVFQRVGGFDESLVRNQDYEMNYRIRQAGGTVVVDPAIRSSYQPRSSLGTLWRQYFDYGFWKVRMLRRHPRSLRWRQIVAPTLVLALTLSGAASLVGLIGLGPRWLLWSLLVVAAPYITANLVVSLILAARRGTHLAGKLPVVFAILHLAWGAGFLSSLLLPRARDSGGRR